MTLLKASFVSSGISKCERLVLGKNRDQVALSQTIVAVADKHIGTIAVGKMPRGCVGNVGLELCLVQTLDFAHDIHYFDFSLGPDINLQTAG